MRLAGMAIAGEGRRLNPWWTASMLSVLSAGQSALSKSGLFRSAVDAQLGAISATSAASVWFSERVIVACDCDRRDIAGRQDGVGGGEDPAEAIANLYVRLGTACFKQLRGAFSVAIWDKVDRTLLIAVDCFAAKPLTYAADAAQILFASQPRAIFA